MVALKDSRFLAVQAAISEAQATPVWERWTIDEVDEGIVRVLVSLANDPAGLQTVSDAIVESAEAGATRSSLRARLHQAAMAVELVSAADQWSVEGAMFVTVRALAGFLREREGKPGLPASRPLREGDVFWVMLASGPGLDRPPTRGTSLDAGAARLATYRERQADVWDVTAAARQVAKLEAHRALEISEDVLDRQQGGPEASAPGPVRG